MQAAILDIKLKHLDEYAAARRNAADYYDKAFANHPKIIIPFRASYSSHVFNQYTLILEEANNPSNYRDGLRKFLADHKIPSMIYYPVPGHRQKMFEHFNAVTQSLPITDWLSDRVISLPMHTELDEEQLLFITNKVLEYVNK
jgi:dTDP-4-amino-4,6-dideoxygalactose transaminase